MIKVLFITRPTVFLGPGGDTIQLLKTKSYLEKLNVQVDIYTPDGHFKFEDYDLVHFFNLRNPQDIIHLVRDVNKMGIPCLLSTIWGSYYECDQKARSGIQRIVSNLFPENFVEYFKTASRIVFNKNFHRGTWKYLVTGHKTSQKEILDSVDYILPNSPTELERVKYDLGREHKAGHWVANAVDLEVFDYSSVNTEKYNSYQGCILCAARIEIRKCQLDLIKAVKGLPYKLVIVGKASPNSISYLEECKKEAGDNVIFIEHVTQEELAELYKVSKVHALISWMETPGLSSLEASVMKSNLLITDRGDTEFYFQDYATYCEPGNSSSIRRGIIEAMNKEFNPELKSMVENNYIWETTAKQTLDAYNIVLAGVNR